MLRDDALMATARRPLGRGELEGMVLDVLWDRGAWMTPGEMHEVIGRRRGLAYTTVMTAMSRLWDKGRLDRRPRGRAFEYHPCTSREEYAADQMSALLAAAGDSRSAIAHFVGQIDSESRTEFLRALRKRGRS